jgi:hypothetical protein
MPTLNEFRSNFFGVRPNRFLVETSWPNGVDSPDLTNLFIYVKGADLPGSTIGTINIAWQGRVVKFSGERTYADWVISVYDSNVPSKDLRTGFERWVEAMDGRNTHAINYNLTSDWIIRYSDVVIGDQYTELPTQSPSNFNKAVRLKNCFPTDIGPVTLNYDVADTFSEFTVQLAYDYWEPYS